ncbi:MAG: DUF456 domain-containing protein [Anaerolineae bacterium]|nr:DUF456 domain-containing protein [Anaerolineae bacterium]
MGETLLAIVAIVLMVIAIVASALPVLPGPLIVWLIGVVFAALTGFARVTWLAVGVMTVLMALGSTTGWWMQALGMKAQGGSCMSILGALFGGLIGTFVIPIPILGTLVGLGLGALLFEFARVGDVRRAAQSGSAALSGYVLSVIVEMGIGGLILVVFVISVMSTG